MQPDPRRAAAARPERARRDPAKDGDGGYALQALVRDPKCVARSALHKKCAVSNAQLGADEMLTLNVD
jgi:hypothetical protein